MRFRAAVITGLVLALASSLALTGTARAIPPHPKFITVAPAHTTSEKLLGDGWTDTRTSTDVRQNMVGCQGVPSPCGRQVLWANSSNNWGVVATMPKGNQSVLTYPDTQKLFTKEGVGSPTPISMFRAIRGHYAVQVPKKGDEGGRPGVSVGGDIEVAGRWSHGQTPAGDPIGKVHFYGQTFTVWRDSSKEPPYTLVLDHNQYSGTVHIKSALYALLHMGVLKKSQMSDDDIELGEEICSTGGVPEAFTYTQDWLYTPGVSQ